MHFKHISKTCSWTLRESKLCKLIGFSSQPSVLIFVLEIVICYCLVTKSRLTLRNPMNCSPPGSSVHGILQARMLEWVAILFSRRSSWGLNPGLLHCRQILFFPEPPGKKFLPMLDMSSRGRVTVQLIRLKCQGPSWAWALWALGVAGSEGEFQMEKESQVTIRKHFSVNVSEKLPKDILEVNRLNLQV